MVVVVVQALSLTVAEVILEVALEVLVVQVLHLTVVQVAEVQEVVQVQMVLLM
jgi:hypothetical protein